jgi:hypothetical protein
MEATVGTRREGHGSLARRRIVGGKRRKAQGSQRASAADQRLRFRQSHGGTGFGSTHKPFLLSRASASKRSSTASPGAYFRYHQHQPSLTSVWLTLVPSDRSTSPSLRSYLSWPCLKVRQKVSGILPEALQERLLIGCKGSLY